MRHVQGLVEKGCGGTIKTEISIDSADYPQEASADARRPSLRPIASACAWLVAHGDGCGCEIRWAPEGARKSLQRKGPCGDYAGTLPQEKP